MRIILLLLLVVVLTEPVLSQVPSKKEMQEQMQSVVNELNAQIADLEKQIAEAKKNKEDPESIKQMEEQLAMLKKQVEMMGGVSKGISKVPDKTINKAIEQENSKGIPKRDNKRINALPKKILTDAELVSFIKKTNSEIEKKIPLTDRNDGAQFYKEANLKSVSPIATAQYANVCWMAGYPETALYLMGKACSDNPADPDNLNNYAAFLTMAGGPEYALPILENLNKKYPGNTTILNNIGQAWFGLGELNKAKTYLKDCMRGFAVHSQANRTMCLIQQSEGNTQEAIESIKKSIGEAYSTEKEALLEELGGKLEYDDVPFRYPIKAEALGIQKFFQSIPDYPFEGGETAARSQLEWYDFKEKVMAAMEAVQSKIEVLKIRVDAHNKRQLANPRLLLPYNNAVHITAKRKMLLLSEWAIERTLALNKEAMEASDSISKWKAEYDEALERLTDCGARKRAATVFLTQANGLNRQFKDKMVVFLKLTLNGQANLAMYTSTDQSEYELIVESIKHGVLTFLYGLHCWFEVGCLPSDVQSQGLRRTLPDFDQMNCDYRETISIPFSKFTIECNKITWEFNAQFLKVKHSTDLNTGKTLNGSVEIGAFKDLPGTQPLGPFTIEGVAEGSLFIEFDQSGITDFGATAGVKAQVGVNVSPEAKSGLEVHTENLGHVGIYEVTSHHAAELAGLHARLGWNSGFTAHGAGILTGGHH